MKCRHHDHATGEYLGACHNACNMRMRLNKLHIPVIFHNGKGYDFHAIVRALSAERAKRVNIIPDNTEKYKMMAFGGYQYPDSMPRFKESFGALLGNDEDLARFARKGLFPYEWLDSPNKLAHP